MAKVKKTKMESVLVSAALNAAKLAANSRCAFMYHQPQMPKEVKRLRKF